MLNIFLITAGIAAVLITGMMWCCFAVSARSDDNN